MAAAIADGGTNPGGRWPKQRSYFHTSSAMYRSLSDLQPLADTTAIRAVDANSPRAQSCARIDPSPRAAMAPAALSAAISGTLTLSLSNLGGIGAPALDATSYTITVGARPCRVVSLVPGGVAGTATVNCTLVRGAFILNRP